MSTRQERFERRMARKCTDVIDDEKLPATKRNTKTGQTKRKNIHGIVALERAAGEPAPRPTSINKANLKLAEASHTPVLRSPRPIHRMTGEKTKAIAPPANELDTGNESTTSNAKPGRVYGVAVFHKRTRLLQPMNTTNSRVAEAHGRRVSNSKISDNVIIKTEPKSPVSLYSQLQALADRGGYITNADDFECIICMTMIDVGDGVRLRQCLHQFCLDCLKSSIVLCDEAEIPCPFGDGKIKCESTLLDSEIRAILSSDEYEKHLQRSLRYAEGTIQNTIHCKLVDCDGWCICEDNVNQFDCPKCKSVNCVSCQAIHHGLNCKGYQEKLRYENMDENEKYFDDLIMKNAAMKCPKCQIVIMKRDGCDWIQCSMCRTEICWATKQARWGPGGLNDTSGGCRCMVNGKRCHPNCRNCH